MAIPSTGTTYEGAGLNDLDPTNLERGKLRQVLVRDARGAATNISPHNSDGSINWSPFALDGTWRADLVGAKLIGGYWVGNPTTPNEGFFQVGAFKEGAGPETAPTMKNDNFMIVQSNFPFDSDLVEEGEPFNFTPVETAKPLVRRLRNNLRLNAADGSVLIEDPGTLNAGWGRTISGDNIERQVLLVSQFTHNSLPFYTVDGYSLAKMSNIGKSKKDKKESEGSQLDYEPIPDGFFMAMQDGVYQPVLRWTWQGGAGWTARGGVPILSAAATGATATTTGKATLTTPDPTGTGDPFTITAQSTIDDGVTWLTAVLDNPGAVVSASGTTTVKVKTVTAGSTKFRIKVVGTNGATAYTVKSAAITIT